MAMRYGQKFLFQKLFAITKHSLLHRVQHLLERGFSCITTLSNILIQNIILSLFTIPFVLKCATKILKIGLQVKDLTSKNVFE